MKTFSSPCLPLFRVHVPIPSYPLINKSYFVITLRLQNMYMINTLSSGRVHEHILCCMFKSWLGAVTSVQLSVCARLYVHVSAVGCKEKWW